MGIRDKVLTFVILLASSSCISLLPCLGSSDFPLAEANNEPKINVQKQAENGYSCRALISDPVRITLNKATARRGAQFEITRHPNDSSEENDSRPLHCYYEIAAKNPDHHLVFSVAQFFAMPIRFRNCSEAYIRLFDSETPSFPRRPRQRLLQICPPLVVPPVLNNFTSSKNAFVLEIYARRRSSIARFKASAKEIGPAESKINDPESIVHQSESTVEKIINATRILNERAVFMFEHPAQPKHKINSGCFNSRNQTGLRGSFNSLTYPCPYGPRLRCTWDIMVPEGMVIVIAFNTIFYIEPSSPAQTGATNNCSNDFLGIYWPPGSNSSSTNETERLARRYCGSKAPSPFYINSNRVRIVFQSDDLIDGYGFRLHWAAATQEDIEKFIARSRAAFAPPGSHRPGGAQLVYATPKDAEACASNTRGAVLTNKSGYLTSPNFGAAPDKQANKYPANTKCTWIISGAADQVIAIYVLDFTVERSPNCSFDALEIYDGANKLGRFCNTDFVPAFFSKTNKILVNFTSDNYVEDKGFRIFYRIVSAATSFRTGRRHQTIEPQSQTKANLTSVGFEEAVGEFRSPIGIACGTANFTNFGANFGEGCHGALIQNRWLVSTANCLSTINANQTTSFYKANITAWQLGSLVGNIKQIYIRLMAQSKRPPFTAFTLVQLKEPARNLGPLCLPSVSEDDDTPDASCLFPSTSSQTKLTTIELVKLSNLRCAQIISSKTAGLAIAPEQLHFFECFSVRNLRDILDVKHDNDTLGSFCQIQDNKAYFDTFPIEICRNYEDAWTLQGVLVQMLTSRNCGNNGEKSATGPKLVAVFIRVSHFINWIVSIIGDG